MKLAYINNDTQVNLDNIDAIKIIKRKDKLPSLSVVISGVSYIVDEEKAKNFISTIDNYEKGISKTMQYYAL